MLVAIFKGKQFFFLKFKKYIENKYTIILAVLLGAVDIRDGFPVGELLIKDAGIDGPDINDPIFVGFTPSTGGFDRKA